MKFKVLSRQEIENFYTSEKHIVISIYDPESRPVEIYSDNPPEGILYMKFPDIDKELKKATKRNGVRESSRDKTEKV